MKTTFFAATALFAAAGLAAPAAEPDALLSVNFKSSPWRPLIPFTSKFSVCATPDQVVNGTTPTGGLEGAVGYYNFGLNSKLDIICYNIKLVNFRGDYQSPANTATHIHEAARGASGPPRIAFPNPKVVPGGPENERISVGCISGPFKTGVVNNVTKIDSGDGFTIAKLEANPAAFFADVHSSLAVPGAVRGQLA
ncbi:uncharacterized protein K489DRAFT_389297 [Dissoconium aciculare CBS 342.82]|uniref:CHRD domain-containing protein n=1 Tax=Dissoconium aciculare CBS 342.82 TaxID=1314786 RepID=A0A6J3M398_9PEZI|nr:uncharacterized protein K489DRAFT_389297 [Dissoconium aciculare CBS 342.82]KAF1822465.1 hypothetical protein K489DRAFT_389297 [Dissoconium aciculare CBS 342.82]